MRALTGCGTVTCHMLGLQSLLPLVLACHMGEHRDDLSYERSGHTGGKEVPEPETALPTVPHEGRQYQRA